VRHVPFNALLFPVFLLAALALFYACPVAYRRTCLLLISLAYYCWWSVPYAALLVGLTAVTWWLTGRVAATEDDAKRGRLAVVAVLVPLVVLIVFKYGAATWGQLAPAFGVTGALALAAPIGVSYYAFKLISFALDTHWGKIRQHPSLRDTLSYATFFPQILSGPIQRAPDFLEQNGTPLVARPELFVSGLRLVLFGFFKKLVVADRLAIVVDQVFERPASFSSVMVMLACYLYAVQLYADFSGFTDIAIGVGRLFGICAPKNFNSPFYAPTIVEFWRRWHMSLSSWLTDYLFTPLRMSLRNWGQAGLILSLAVNMVIIGIWHGPRATFVVFGALNAAYMIGSALTMRRRDQLLAKRPALKQVRRILGPVIVFHLMVIAFIPFRSETLTQARTVFGGFVAGLAELGRSLLGGHLPALHADALLSWSPQHSAILALAIVVMEIAHLSETRGALERVFVARGRVLRWGVYYGMVAAILLFAPQQQLPSIYFKF
jgi:D-alanyl-lipoteichoic acid acyltransferase DltB (MBOAT superfamily)